ncbi:HAD-IIIC family phosphatase [Nonomuraea sp. NPDC049695]|uniref:HAD-IIIC family phosphatase n=1 Tax=Nonomuraea sp. NPDC049695 TaxID=3154734 RepID=UPI00341263BF
MTGESASRTKIKCVVWDLDGTLWDGVLLEDEEVKLRDDMVELIHVLDRRGVLNSVASRNDAALAMAKLAELGLAEMFVYPQIGWNAKSSSVATVARRLNVGIDALAFIDDQEFERAEVARAHPAVLCLDPASAAGAIATPAFTPRFVTEDSRRRREMFRSQIRREDAEEDFVGTPEEFLAQLGMRFTIRAATRADLQRAEELTVRTNQLNSTGRTYSYEELEALCASPDHLVLVAELEDVFGTYGTIGLALVERGMPYWHLRLLLMSCRTMSRGVGTVLLNHVMSTARGHGAKLRADFVQTGRNRLMQITYAFAGFVEAERDGAHVVLESDLERIQAHAPYIEVIAP